IRFYVQQGLLPTPLGRGRGRHYDGAHLQALRRIAELQAGGHSLDAIRRIMSGQSVPPPVADERPRTRPALLAELWTRLRIAEGLELHFDATKFSPDVGQLIALRDEIRAIMLPDPAAPDASPQATAMKASAPPGSAETSASDDDGDDDDAE